jgi:hypothetical protein
MLHFTPHIKPSKGYMSHVYGRGDIGDRDLFNLNCTLVARLDIWYKADKFVLYMDIAPESSHVSYAWLGSI